MSASISGSGGRRYSPRRYDASQRPWASASGMIAPSGCSSPMNARLSIPGLNTRRNSGRSLSGAEMKSSSKNGNVTL